MRLRGRQGRFLGLTIGGWIMLRVWLLWPAASGTIGGAVAAQVEAGAMSSAGVAAAPTPAAQPQAISPDRLVPHPASAIVAGQGPTKRAPLEPMQVPRTTDLVVASSDRRLSAAPPVDRSLSSSAPLQSSPMVRSGRAIEGQAYLFVRPGSGHAALAPGGSLGGSQAAARVAVALNRDGPVRTAIAARLYAPLGSKGAEAAVGLDWHPLANVPLRFSVERRVGLDRAGRNAWSASAAGGFFAAGLPLGLEADGYAQAGVVGARSRDLFVDGALRAGRRIALGEAAAVVGAGTWGAAQPGAARLDVGPRLALSLPVDRHRLTLAAEGRFRLAGRASPGSGAALTLATDF